MSFAAILRAETAAEHERVDAAYARFDLAEPRSYTAFLRAHARALGGAEVALAEHGLAGRVRLPDLTADLAELGVSIPTPLPLTLGPAAAWGARYVVEGSRLGGALLARQVGTGLPRRYLASVHAPGEWRAVRSAIDAAAGDDAWRTSALAGARATFALYRAAANTERTPRASVERA